MGGVERCRPLFRPKTELMVAYRTELMVAYRKNGVHGRSWFGMFVSRLGTQMGTSAGTWWMCVPGTSTS